MPIKLHGGYSRKTIQKNIAELMVDGFSRNAAIRAAFDHARASFFRLHPQGALPVFLAYPYDKRLAKHYTPGGAPMRSDVTGNNPVRALDIDDDEREEITQSVQKQLTGRGAAVRKAAALYTDFTGHEDVELTKINVPTLPEAVVAFGKVDAIMYSTVRDGIAEKYIHKFKASSRPLLTASPDGKQLYLIGGSYDFTDRGIVDS